MISAVHLLTEVSMFETVFPAGIISLPTRVELVELVGCIGGSSEEGSEELFRVLIVGWENRFKR